jgi:hypothetical protein
VKKWEHVQPRITRQEEILDMKMNKKKSVTIRITEQQYRNLIDTIVDEKINTSEFIRESIRSQIGRIKRKRR